MPVFLGGDFEKTWAGAPPGMAPQDNPIWQNFRSRFAEDIRRVYYNVRVGGGSAASDIKNPEDILMWLQITMLRIDAVVETKDEAWIIEVKPNAGRTAFGAVQIYLTLWNADPKINKPAIPVIVTDTITPQMRAICELSGIKVVVV